MAKLKIGAFGAFRGHTMISVLENHPDAELVAVCDKYEPLLEQVRNEAKEKGLNVACYTDFEDFFKHDMDAVVLANYANEHGTYAVRLLNSGRHVLSEVLPCETMAQAVALVEAVERSGKVYAYAENYCYMWHTFEMWRRYKLGDIGEVRYGEGEYVHDCSSIWPGITYGDPTHWRNRMHPNFYCTHSAGPLIAMSGLRPVRVSGFLTSGHDLPTSAVGSLAGDHGAIEMITMENGAIFKSLHGHLKREPSSVNYEYYGTRGCMESQRMGEELLNVYREEVACHGETETYHPEKFIEKELSMVAETHGGSDFYPTHFFIQKIFGRPDGMEWSIDVYTAVNMGMCGILGYRSVLEGGKPYDIPDMHDPAQRDLWRNDNACCTPAVAGDQLLPSQPGGNEVWPPEAYDYIRKEWEEGRGFDFKSIPYELQQKIIAYRKAHGQN